jgi:hypothetical protein
MRLRGVEWWRNGTAQLLIRHRLDELVKPLTLFKLVIDARGHAEADAPAQTLRSTPERRRGKNGSMIPEMPAETTGTQRLGESLDLRSVIDTIPVLVACVLLDCMLSLDASDG